MFFSLNSIDWWLKFIIFGLVVVLSGCEDGAARQFAFTGPTMGTSYSIKVIGAKVDAGDLQQQVDERLAALSMVFSTYIEDSEISRINSNLDKQLSISDNMAAVLGVSQQVHEFSGGAFDVTVGPLVNLWGFGPDGRVNGVPDDAAIELATSQTVFNRLVIRNRQLQRPLSLYIDLSAVAKGYAVDEIAGLLEAAGAEHYMVEIGGEVKTRGKNSGGSDWIIGIEAPDRQARRLYRTLPVVDLALATSGDYRNFFEHQGAIYSHTIDPRTGWPVSHSLGSVTVLHESAAMADALATAFSVLGPDETMRLAEEENLMVLAIIRQGDGYDERLSGALVRYLDSR